MKPHHEEQKIQAPTPEPPSPDLDQLKEEIVDSIKIHFDSCKYKFILNFIIQSIYFYLLSKIGSKISKNV